MAITTESVTSAIRVVIKICGLGGILYLIAIISFSGYIMQTDAITFGAQPLSWILVVIAWALGLIVVAYSTLRSIRSSDLTSIVLWFGIALIEICAWFFILAVLTGMRSII